MKDSIGKLGPGESAFAKVSIPAGAERGYITLDYEDEYGNTYQTRILVDFKKLKIIKQEFRKVKIVKDVGNNIPILGIDEESLQMLISTNNAEVVKRK